MYICYVCIYYSIPTWLRALKALMIAFENMSTLSQSCRCIGAQKLEPSRKLANKNANEAQMPKRLQWQMFLKLIYRVWCLMILKHDCRARAIIVVSDINL